ncbi:MAG: hypothetical protein ACUVWX_10540, partial [Kiritimatiellia bacterium]
LCFMLALGLLCVPASVCGAPTAIQLLNPRLRKTPEGVEINFGVNFPTDVELAVVNAEGKVLRHLAAGWLGGTNAPPAPLKPGLVQTIIWDGKDDKGEPVSRKGLSVRLRAGMQALFGRIIGASPYTGTVSDIACAPDGTLFINMGSYVSQLHHALPLQIRQFDSAGNYIRTLLPHPPSTRPEKATAFELLGTGDGLLTPANYTPLDPVLFRLGALHHRTVAGALLFVDGSAGLLHFFKLDGSNDLRTIPMRSSPEKLKWPSWLSPQVALSPDGKYAYYSNVANTPYDGKHPRDIDPNFPQGRIYRHDISRPGTDPEKFYDLELPDWEQTKYWLPSAWDKRTAASGIDTDARGNVVVCDLVNQQVTVVDPQSRKIGSVKVPWPDRVIVSRKTGAMYVMSCAVSRGFRPPAELYKIEGIGSEARIVARLPLKGKLGYSLALNETGERPLIWISGPDSVIRVEDRGSELATDGISIVNRDKNAIGFVCYGDADGEAELVYITQGMGPVWRYHGETGQGGLAPIRASDLAIGPGGMIYAWGDTGGYDGPVTRYTRDFKSAPLPSTGKHTYGMLRGRYGRGNSVAGLDVDIHGRVFATSGGNSCQVIGYDAEGNPIEFGRVTENERGSSIPALITGMVDQSGSIRVDIQGNVYVLQLGLPKGHVPPKGFEKDPAYLRCTGTIYKFGAQGGEFRGGVAVGALRRYSTACGPISGAWNSTQSVCHCMKPRFDVDGFGRLYIPNAFTYKVVVCDNEDNQILSFGGYGNFDAQGPDSSEPKPEIPLGWPIVVCATDKYVYVGDCLNHRIVRVDKVFAAEMLRPLDEL